MDSDILAIDRRALQAKLETFGLALEPMPADGNCQFHAICHQMRRLVGEEIDPRQLRQEVVKELKRNIEYYRMYSVEGTLEGCAIDDYIASMGEDGFWGDNYSLQAVADLHQVTIICHSSLPDAAPHRITPTKGVESIAELHIAHAHGRHYDSTTTLQRVGAARPPPGPVLGAGQAKRPRVDSNAFVAHENMVIDREDELAVSAAVRKQQQSPNTGSNVRGVIGLLYSDVSLSNLDKNMATDTFSSCLYHVAIVTGDVSLTYTRLAGGDGVWRLWPVLEIPRGTMDQPSQFISKAPLPLRTSRKNARFKCDLQGRLALPDATNHRRVLIKLFLEKLHGSDYGCIFPHTITLLSSIRLVNEKQAALSSVAELANEIVPLERLKMVHQPFCEAVKNLFFRLKINHNSDRSNSLVNKALEEYDSMIKAWTDNHGDSDEEAASMDRADKDRQDHSGDDAVLIISQLETNAHWGSNFRNAVHEGARRLLARVFDRKKAIADCLKDLVRNDEARVAEILNEFNLDGSNIIGPEITSNHLKGEALELLFCYLSLVRSRAELRDYLEERQQGVDSNTNIIHRECEVVQCFMSSAPHGSPFRMTENHRNAICAALGGQNEAEKQEAARLAARLYSFALRDRFFDVLVWLKDLNGKSHFQLAQCKARGKFKASVDIAKYVGHLFAARTAGADALGSLMRFEFVSNVFACKQMNRAPINSGKEDGDFAVLHDGGHLEIYLFDNMLGEAENIFSAAEMACTPFGLPEALKVPDMVRKELRKCQNDAVAALLEARGTLKLKGGTVVAATGSGKSITAFVDALEALEEQGNDMPLLWTCPRIYLLMQSALGFAQWERFELSLKIANEGKLVARYYYLVCSADDISTPALRVITNAQVLSTMLRHMTAGTLGHCRFFSTVEGSGGLWDEVNKFIRVTRGSDARLDGPVFGVFVRDEVHVQCGLSCTAYSLGLNIPAKWYVSYTATPSAELTRTKAIKEAIDQMRESNGEDPSEDSDINQNDAGVDPGQETSVREVAQENGEQSDADSEEGSLDHQGEFDWYEVSPDDISGKSGVESEEEYTDDGDNSFEGLPERAEWMERQIPEEVFTNPYQSDLKLEENSNDPALVEAATAIGLKGVQLLSDNLQFVSLEHLAKEKMEIDGSLLTINDIKAVLKAWVENPSIDAVKKALPNRQVVLFKVDRELTLGMCTCSKAKNESDDKNREIKKKYIHDQHCASILRNASKDKKKRYLFRAKYDRSAGNFRPEDYCDGNSKIILGINCVVLGVYRDEGEETLCLRNGPPRGVAVHDSTAYGMYDPLKKEQKITNLVGKALHTFTFAEAFDSEEPILARPALAVYSLDPFALPLDTSADGIMGRVHSWLGINQETRKKKGGDAIESGIVIKNLNKVKLQITFAQNGGTVIVATAHDYASAAHLLRSFEGGHVTKAIVFCPSVAACRRVMALFKAIVSRRIADLLADGDQTIAAKLKQINCGHVFQSESKDGKIIREQPRHVRQQLMGQFLIGELEVLFNTNLLSTGVDFPCCDAVHLTCHTKDPRTLMQRWGRALRYVKSRPDKKGYLALVSTDPYETTEDIKSREDALGISGEIIFENEQALTEAQFDAMYRVAECAVDPSRRIIGVVFKIICDWVKASKASRTWKPEGESQKSLADLLLMTKSCSGTEFSLTPEHEKLFNSILKAQVVDLRWNAFKFQEFIAINGRFPTRSESTWLRSQRREKRNGNMSLAVEKEIEDAVQKGVRIWAAADVERNLHDKLEELMRMLWDHQGGKYGIEVKQLQDNIATNGNLPPSSSWLQRQRYRYCKKNDETFKTVKCSKMTDGEQKDIENAVRRGVELWAAADESRSPASKLNELMRTLWNPYVGQFQLGVAKFQKFIEENGRLPKSEEHYFIFFQRQRRRLRLGQKSNAKTKLTLVEEKDIETALQRGVKKRAAAGLGRNEAEKLAELHKLLWNPLEETLLDNIESLERFVADNGDIPASSWLGTQRKREKVSRKLALKRNGSSSGGGGGNSSPDDSSRECSPEKEDADKMNSEDNRAPKKNIKRKKDNPLPLEEKERMEDAVKNGATRFCAANKMPQQPLLDQLLKKLWDPVGIGNEKKQDGFGLDVQRLEEFVAEMGTLPETKKGSDDGEWGWLTRSKLRYKLAHEPNFKTKANYAPLKEIDEKLVENAVREGVLRWCAKPENGKEDAVVRTQKLLKRLWGDAIALEFEKNIDELERLIAVNGNLPSRDNFRWLNTQKERKVKPGRRAPLTDDQLREICRAILRGGERWSGLSPSNDAERGIELVKSWLQKLNFSNSAALDYIEKLNSVSADDL